MLRHLLICVLLCLPASLYGQLTVVTSEAQRVKGIDQLIQIGDEVYLRKVQQGLDLETVGLVRVQTEAANVTVEVEDIKREPIPFDKINNEYYRISKSGKFWIEVTALDFAKNIYAKENRILVVGQSPTPDPSPDPTPDPPGPDPPEPTPDAPIDAEGMHILFVAESSDASALTKGQREILFALEGRNFLNSVAGDKWRAFDQHVQFTDPNEVWAKALMRPRTSLPWVIISNGVTGFEGPMPGSLADLKKLVEEYK